MKKYINRGKKILRYAKSLINSEEYCNYHQVFCDLEMEVEDFNEKFANPYKAAALGYIDDVIEPSETRAKLIRALDMLVDKEELRPARKHGNIPL